MKEEIIKNLIQKIFEHRDINIKKIILFGSRARNDYKKESDWDLLIIIENEIPREQKLEITHIIRKRLAEEFIPCDVLIKSEREIEERKDVIGSVIRTALKEGIPL
ncbi:MAG: nucleotidyltransferase domain-containing protein [Candidatus Omnitrophica bacterium]|nr:nucleotidyltransferase domain-containing protein [Candidatus Omnitrophota bacterium]MCM8810914.1 nucleotidyltransferase domain-containing protein [Candidatus Omnitrophota bacterium]